ncbi:MAG: hypothetical protein K1X55_18110 [Chitinophagales bacterium]|nr:hypothetical protein [Chitinophagales bacterium]
MWFLRVIVLALFAACFATMGDAVHKYTGTIGIPEIPFKYDIFPVFRMFVIAFVSMGTGYFMIAKYLKKPLKIEESDQQGSLSPFVEALFTFLVVYFLSGFGHKENALLASIFFIGVMVRLAFTYDRIFMSTLVLLIGISGASVEMMLNVAYTSPEINGVPFWLFGLYMHGAFALREGMRLLVYRSAK